MLRVVIDNMEYDAEEGLTIYQILNAISYHSDYPVILANVNNEVRDLDYVILNDCNIEPLDITDKIANSAMINGLVFTLLVSVKELLGKEKDIFVDHSLDKGLYIETNFKLTKDIFNNIKSKMSSIIKEGWDIKRVTVDRLDAIKYYTNTGDNSKVENLRYNTNSYVSLYRLGNYYDYFYTKMPYNTKLLNSFDLTYIDEKSLMLNFPTIYSPLEIPKYVHHKNMYKVFNDCKTWARFVGLENASDLNKIISLGYINHVIRMCENKLNSEFLEFN